MNKYVIVRACQAGVFAGELESRDGSGWWDCSGGGDKDGSGYGAGSFTDGEFHLLNNLKK